VLRPRDVGHLWYYPARRGWSAPHRQPGHERRSVTKS